MKKIKLLFFLLVVFISGCSVNNIIDPYYSDKPFNFYGLDSSNPNIVAWGRFNKPYFELSVENKSNKPIGITYFLDLFTLFTHDGKEYILEKKIYYSSGYSINTLCFDSSKYLVDKLINLPIDPDFRKRDYLFKSIADWTPKKNNKET